jgi:hypothetical protein
VSAVDAAKHGAQVWARAAANTLDRIVPDGLVDRAILMTQGDQVAGLDPATGAVAWQTPKPASGNGYIRAFADGGDTYYVGR